MPCWGGGRLPTPPHALPTPTGAHAGVDAVLLGAETVGVAPAAPVPEALAGPRVPPVVPAQREIGAGGAGVLIQGAQPGHDHRPPALPGAGGCRGQPPEGHGEALGGPGRGDGCQPPPWYAPGGEEAQPPPAGGWPRCCSLTARGSPGTARWCWHRRETTPGGTLGCWGAGCSPLRRRREK